MVHHHIKTTEGNYFMQQGSVHNNQPLRYIAGHVSIYYGPYVSRYESDVSNNPGEWIKLKIDGTDPAFFVDNVKNSSSFYISNTYGRFTILAFLFCQSTRFKRVVKFDLETDGALNQGTRHSVPVIGIYTDNNRSIQEEEARKLISQHTRSSNTLDNCIRISDSVSLYPDHGGFGIVSSNVSNSLDQIFRSFLCQALTMGYVHVLQSLSQLAANKIQIDDPNKRSEIIEVYEAYLYFLTVLYTNFPIKRDRHTMSSIWEVLAEHQKIHSIRTEVEVELQRLGEFIHAESMRKQLEMQSELLESQNKRAEADKIEYAQAESARLRDQRFQKRSARRQNVLNAIVALLSLIVATVSIPENTRSDLILMADDIWIGFQEDVLADEE